MHAVFPFRPVRVANDENFFRIVMALPTERGCVRTRKESRPLLSPASVFQYVVVDLGMAFPSKNSWSNMSSSPF